MCVYEDANIIQKKQVTKCSGLPLLSEAPSDEWREVERAPRAVEDTVWTRGRSVGAAEHAVGVAGCAVRAVEDTVGAAGPSVGAVEHTVGVAPGW